MARRWVLTAIVTVVLVAAAVVAAHAIRDDETDPESAARATTTSSVTTAPPSTTAAPTTTTPATTTTLATASTATTGPPGPCGNDAGPIRVAINAAITGASTNADVAGCRLAASDPSWAAVQLTAKSGAQFDARTVVLHGSAGSWTVVATGGANAGCGQAPQQVIVDLGQFCAGTGGSTR
jgi:hypothetical protein